jgi:hypothetical protein
MISESKIQASCIKYAKSKGWFVLKVIRCNINGYPDCTFFKDGKTFFVEFKTEIGKQSKLQQYVESELISQGFKYFLIRDLKEFKKSIVELQ